MTKRRTGRPLAQLPEPNFVDKVFAYFNPQQAVSRLKARTALAYYEAYEGASKKRKGLKYYNGTTGSANSDLLPALDTLRSRSRHLVRNNALAAGAISTKVTHTVGSGLVLQSKLEQDAAFLKIAPEVAAEIELNIEREWALWANTKACDLSGHDTFGDLLGLIWRQTLENGDCFVLFTRTERKNTPYSLRLQIIESDQVSNPNNVSDTLELSGGVECDEYGQPVAYHVEKHHPGNVEHRSSVWDRIPAENSLGLPNIIHVFKKLRPGQSRGVPVLAPVIESLKQIGDYTEGELQAAVIAGLFAVFIETNDGQGMSSPDVYGEQTSSSTESEFGELKAGTGNIINGMPGEKVSVISNTRPNQMFDAFTMSVLNQVASGLEVPLEVLTKHFTSSYSASRAALMEAWRHFKDCRQWLVRHVCEPIYEYWLYEAVLTGRVAIPGYLTADPAYQMAYRKASWIGPSPGQLDPVKETRAAMDRMNSGLSTLEQETVELTGGDYSANLLQAAKEQALLKSAGLKMEVIQNDKSQKP